MMGVRRAFVFGAAAWLSGQGCLLPTAAQTPATDPPAQPVKPPDYAAQAMAIVESYQREYAAEPNGWSAVADAIKTTDDTLAGLDSKNPALREFAASQQIEGTAAEVQTRLFQAAIGLGETTAQSRDLADQFVTELDHAHFFDGLAALTRSRHIVEPAPTGRLFGRDMPAPGILRRLVLACAARAAIADRRGDTDELVAAVEQLAALARVGTHQGFMSEYLVGHAAMYRLGAVVRGVALRPHPDPVLCGRLLEAIDKQADLAPLVLCVDVERLVMLDGIDAFFEKTCADATVGLEPGEAARKAQAIRLLGVPLAVASQPDQNAKAETYIRLTRELGSLVKWKRRNSNVQIPEEFDDLPLPYAALSAFIPNFADIFRTSDQSEMFLAGARMMMGLELYRARHAEFPERLATLVPEVFKELPSDPYSAEGFRYRRVDAAQDPDHRGYLLYSVGWDGEDNDGRECPDGPQNVIGRAVRGRGFDYVINSPRD